jgi:dihydroorotate dehydrogenase
MLYKYGVRPILFALSRDDPEIAHEWTIARLEFAARHPRLLNIIATANTYKHPTLERELFGLHFPNPVGLAAGFDKNGRCLHTLAALGFGFIEAGGVTRYPQAGNDRPRIFRFPRDQALINRMNFPNQGADAIAARMASSRKPDIPIGWQIAKSATTPLEKAAEDYVYSLRKLYPYGDYFTVNVSCPNTPGLRQLQHKEPLDQLLHAIVEETSKLAGPGGKPKPVLVKISPDLTEDQIDDVLEVALNRGIRGIIATNTSINHESLHTTARESGGLSGRPLALRALNVVRFLCKYLDGRLPVIGTGGIFGPDDARRMFDAGASLIQVYTGLIYEGPSLIKRINKALAHQPVPRPCKPEQRSGTGAHDDQDAIIPLT